MLVKLLKIHGTIITDVDASLPDEGPCARKALALVPLNPCTLEKAQSIVSPASIELPWLEIIEDNLEDNETIGAIHRIELLDEQGRIISVGRVRYDSLMWEPVEKLSADQIHETLNKADHIETQAAEACRAGDFCSAKRLTEQAAYCRSLAEAATLCQPAFGKKETPPVED